MVHISPYLGLQEDTVYGLNFRVRLILEEHTCCRPGGAFSLLDGKRHSLKRACADLGMLHGSRPTFLLPLYVYIMNSGKYPCVASGKYCFPGALGYRPKSLFLSRGSNYPILKVFGLKNCTHHGCVDLIPSWFGTSAMRESLCRL